MKRELKNSILVITGASSGIGRAAALEATRRGATVVLAARREGALKEAAAECGPDAQTLVVPTDVTNEKAVQELARHAVETFGRIDVWINNAAVTLFSRFEETPMDDFRRVIETNLFGYIHGARAVIPHYREQGGGMLIDVASVVAYTGQSWTTAYSTSKFAIRGLDESLRQELHKDGIDVCSVYPPSTDTPLFQQGANYTGRAVKPLSPVIEAERVARAIVGLVEHPRREVFVGCAGRLATCCHEILPGPCAWLAARVVEKEHFQNSPAPPTRGNLYAPMPEFATISGGWTKRRPGHGLRIARACLNLLTAAGAACWLLKNQRQLRGKLAPALERAAHAIAT